MRNLKPKEVAVIRPQPAVMINHGEISVPVSSEIAIATKTKCAMVAKTESGDLVNKSPLDLGCKCEIRT